MAAQMSFLAVAAGEGPVSALDRVVSRTHGELSVELARVLADIDDPVEVVLAAGRNQVLFHLDGIDLVSRLWLCLRREGYGQTECTTASNVNMPTSFRFATSTFATAFSTMIGNRSAPGSKRAKPPTPWS